MHLKIKICFMLAFEICAVGASPTVAATYQDDCQIYNITCQKAAGHEYEPNCNAFIRSLDKENCLNGVCPTESTPQVCLEHKCTAGLISCLYLNRDDDN